MSVCVVLLYPAGDGGHKYGDHGRPDGSFAPHQSTSPGCFH